MRLPPREPGMSRADYKNLIREFQLYAQAYTAFSDEHRLFELCPRAECRRAKSCAAPESRECVRTYVRTTGDLDFWRELYTRLADGGSTLLPWRQMAKQPWGIDAVAGDAVEDDDECA
ncbi:hypothetical protein GJW-30_1_00871 [Variibacter gotjawalensis]|uniref:Uncharacterized protein n=1 Tax=Variibacter gotjawalensis TaxID=1333996 RepID=A0A0S3PQW5_9BRAD|nr:hypothetical protein [Variibacter gotjawalensis]NIK48649.1 hypothetical protein [Variibacter gotjawalensis]RZS50512.1 hypothetical protein EV661_2978 [Variibacter gotjawalensis]BAT58347.1 hypothetical protein GJW-30_1_00871 [Variibacter gotjawalensis]